MGLRQDHFADLIQKAIHKDILEMEAALNKLKYVVTEASDTTIDVKMCKYFETINQLSAANTHILRDYIEFKKEEK
jgi:hypothetical protein